MTVKDDLSSLYEKWLLDGPQEAFTPREIRILLDYAHLFGIAQALFDEVAYARERTRA